MAAILLLLLLLAVPAAAKERLVLTTGMREPWTNPAHTGFTDLLVRELFRRLGVEAEVSVNLAASRALRLADDGVDDGLAARVAGLEKDLPNLVRVPEKIFDNDFVAASPALTLETPDWGSLAPYSVGYILGWQVFDHNLKPTRELTLTKDSTQLFSLLAAGRVEVILHERWQALWQARALGQRLTVHEPPLARVPMYLYLHRRHSALVEPVAAELRRMKSDGSYQQVADRAFGGLGPVVLSR